MSVAPLAETVPGGLAVSMAPSGLGGQLVRDLYAHPDWAIGCIAGEDAWFLADCLALLRPRRMIEIGVASGVSTAFLLRAIERLGLATHLYSFDVIDRYYADPARPLGAYLDEAFDHLPAGFSLFPSIRSMDVPRALAAAGAVPADLAFIDADHSHPWPCLDLLALLPVLAPGSWVILHDIDLANIYPARRVTGPVRLFERWPGEKAMLALPGQRPNIGAIRLLADVHETIGAVLAALDEPWDKPVNAAHFLAVTRQLRGYGRGEASRLRAAHRRNVAPLVRLGHFVKRAAASLRRRALKLYN